MKTSTSTLPFRKTAACPASATLLSYCTDGLSAAAALTVKEHLEICDFCNAEIPLLAHHKGGTDRGPRPPEIPMDLRILAESILARKF